MDVVNIPVKLEDVGFDVGAGLVPAQTGRPQGAPLHMTLCYGQFR